MSACNNTTYYQMINDSEELRLQFFKISFAKNMLEHNAPTAMAINKTVTPIWIVIGTFGNIISALVWANPRMRTCNTAAYYLTCLAVADLTFLIVQMFSELEMPWLLGTLDVQGWCQIFSVVNISVQYFCVFLVFAFTVERFLSVCHPFKSERFGKTRTPRIILYLLILCIVLGIPQAYFWNLNFVGECQVRPEVNTMKTISFYSVFTWSTELAIFGVLPGCVLILNTAVVMKIRSVGKLKLGKIKFKSRYTDEPSTYIPNEDKISMGEGISSTVSTPCRERLVHHSSTFSGRTKIGATSSAHSKHRGTTITLLWVSFFLIFTMLPNTIMYALQHSVHYGPMPCRIEDMWDDPQWRGFFKFQTIKLIVKEISLSHHVGNVFIYMATSGRFVRLALKSLTNKQKPCSKDSKDTSLNTIRSQHIKCDGDAL